MRGIRGRDVQRAVRSLVGSVGEAILRLAAAGDRPGRAPGQAVDRAGAHGAPDRGPPPDRPHRAASHRATGRAAARPSPDAGGGRGHPSPAARGDHPALADGGPAGGAPSPLDEVRSALAFFDTTLFTAVPRLYRSVDAALDLLSRRSTGARAADAASDSGRTGTRPPRVPPFLHLGSWVGGDRDGNPYVTAEVTAQTMRIASDHVLRGYEAVCSRLMQTFAAAVPPDRLSDRLAARLVIDEETLPETMRMLRRRFPDEPFRQRLGAMAEHLRRTRGVLTEARHAPLPAATTPWRSSSRSCPSSPMRSSRRPGARRVGRAGRPALAGGDVRLLPRLARDPTARAVHRSALATVHAGGDLAVDDGRAPGVSAAEVLATFRGVADVQRRFGVEACRPLRDQLHPAGRRRPVRPGARGRGRAGCLRRDQWLRPRPPELDVVPLLEMRRTR